MWIENVDATGFEGRRPLFAAPPARIDEIVSPVTIR